MSFKAVLSIDGSEFELNYCKIFKARNQDNRGRPASTYQWSIICAMDAIDDTIITDWMINPSMQKEGNIIFYKDDQESKLKEIGFKKAYCTNLIDQFMDDLSYMDCWFAIKGEELNGVS
jgi:hypothetical protein